MKEYCFFEIPGREKICTALIKKDCVGCVFYKTHEQARRDVEHAAEILKKKGLEPYVKGKIMTTRPIHEKENQQFDRFKRKENEEK